MNKPEFVCNACKSHIISGFPTSVYWNVDTGQWEVSDGAEISDMQCQECESNDIHEYTHEERSLLPRPPEPPAPATLLAFVQTIARMETPAEFDARTDDDGMSGDDAVDTVGNLITQARELVKS